MHWKENLLAFIQKIISQFSTIDKDGKKIIEKHQSTAGRFLLLKHCQNTIKLVFLYK